MPQRKSAIKKLRADKKRRLRNLAVKSRLKAEIKKFGALLKSGKKNEAKVALNEVYSFLDKSAKKGIIHKNTASRKKSRLAKKLNQG